MLIYKDRIKKLVKEFLTSRGASINLIHRDLWEARLPGELQKKLETDSETVHLAFTPEFLATRPDCILLTPGAPFIFRILDSLGAGGLSGEGYLPVDQERLDRQRGEIPPGLEFINCKVTLDSTGVEYAGLGVYIYRLQVTGRERREEIIPFFYDLTGLYPDDELTVDQVCSHPLSQDPPVPGEYLKCQSLLAGEIRIRFNFNRQSGRVLSFLQDESDKLLRQEKERVDGYFEIQQGKAKNKEEKEEILKAKKQRTAELQNRFTVKGDASLAMALLVRYPVIRYRLRLERGQTRDYLEITRDLLRDRVIPVKCPRCKKEAQKLGICEIHGTACADEIWTCPVCNKDRCGECEYFECGIDGKKKDPECTFNCQFCLSRVGTDHRVKCEKCGQEGCSQCLQKCADCGRMVCPDCGAICSTCKKTYCRDHLTKCQMCPNHVCDNCSILVCEKCGKKTCHQHSFNCARCGRSFCNDCMGGVDAGSEGILCRDCVHVCPGCKKTVNPDTTGKCSICKTDICSACGRTCDTCGARVCKVHSSTCAVCGKSLCPEHSGFCPGCGNHVCRDHLTKCPVCGISYCRKCRPGDKTQDPCSLCGKLSPVKKGKIQKAIDKLVNENHDLAGVSQWEYSHGKTVYLFQGKDLLTRHTITIKKDTGDVIGWERQGILGRIAGFFKR